jgi:hypothetical protein
MATGRLPPRPGPHRDLVTGVVRSIVSGDAKFHGFGLRVVPDRGIDDGYTVRVQLPKQPKIVLQVHVFTASPPKEPGKYFSSTGLSWGPARRTLSPREPIPPEKRELTASRRSLRATFAPP